LTLSSHRCQGLHERQERQRTIDGPIAASSAWAEAAGHELRAERAFRDAEVDSVAGRSPDCLARKYAHRALILEEFRRAGCAVAFLDHTVADDPGDQLLSRIQGAVAECERARLGERCRRGKPQKARAGWFIGGRAPYRYRSIPCRAGAGGRLAIGKPALRAPVGELRGQTKLAGARS
jgi:site-specific DNA recombinase